MGDLLHILVSSMRLLFELGTRVVLLCVSWMLAISDNDSTLELRNGNLTPLQTKIYTTWCSRKTSNFYVTRRMLKIHTSQKDSSSVNRLITYRISGFISVFIVIYCNLIKGFEEINQSSSYRFASIKFNEIHKRFTPPFARLLWSFEFCTVILQ